MPTEPSRVRIARPEDLPDVVRLIGPFVAERKLLPRTEDDLRALLPSGFVAELEGKLMGFAAVEIYSAKMAELLCLAVDERAQGQGLGRELVQACIDRVRREGVRELLAITSSESFLKSCGFDFTLPDERKALFFRTSN